MIKKHSITTGTFIANKNNTICITTNNKIDSEFCNNNISSDEIIKINDQSKIPWQRRLGHHCNDDITKYLKLHNIKTKCFDSKCKDVIIPITF